MTNRELIQAALRMLTVLDANQTVNSEDAALGLDELNDLMADMLADQGIDLGYLPQDDVSNEFPCSDEDAAAVKPLLAMRLHSFYPSHQLPDSLPVRAGRAMSRLTRDAVLFNMEESLLDHLPHGNGGYGYDISTDE